MYIALNCRNVLSLCKYTIYAGTNASFMKNTWERGGTLNMLVLCVKHSVNNDDDNDNHEEGHDNNDDDDDDDDLKII